jgi:peptidoglycan hydrolase-like protein with peptidoglycan-binding domain
MKKLALALLASAAISMPAMAASNMNQQPQKSQSQQSQSQQSQPQAQNTNSSQGQMQSGNRSAQNQSMGSQPMSPDGLSRSEVRQVQQALDKDGFQVGRVDGRWGPETSNALKQFQESKKIQSSGQLDQQTLSKLGLNGARFSQQSEQNTSRRPQQNEPNAAQQH